MQWADLAKLAIAPMFVAIITLIGRRAGPAVAGFLAALPVVAAPILGLIVAAHGNAFGATSALGSAIGTAPTMLFAFAFARFAERLPPFSCLLAAYGVYFVATLAALAVPVSWAFAIAVPAIAWLLILRAFPHYEVELKRAPALPWDLPMRITATFILVATVTSCARALGPKVAGLVTPFPIITATLALFSYRQGGAETAAILLRSLVRGLASFMVFFWVVGFLLPRTHAVLAFSGSILTCLLFHAALNQFGIGAPAPRVAPAQAGASPGPGL